MIRLAEQTRVRLADFVKTGHHAALLHGATGVGLNAAAEKLLNLVEHQPTNRINVSPEDGKEISIARIRELYALTRSQRTPEQLLAVVIDDAGLMSIPAQNALLKLLEEPPANVLFLLLTHHENQLLKTITSRTVPIEVSKLSHKQTKELIDSYAIDSAKKAQVMFLANGLPAEATRLMTDEAYFEAQTAAVRDARSFLTGTAYERIVISTRYVKDRTYAIDFVRKLSLLLNFTAFKNAEFNPKNLSYVSDTADNLQSNGNIRLALLSLSLRL